MTHFFERRFVLFSLVGGSGVLVDLGFFQLLQIVGLPVMWASLSSALIAMTTNFILNSLLTWAGDKEGSLWLRFLRFVAVSALGIGIKLLVLYVLYHGFGVHQLLGNALGIAVATVWNYSLNRIWTFRMTHSDDKRHAAEVKPNLQFVKSNQLEARNLKMMSRPNYNVKKK